MGKTEDRVLDFINESTVPVTVAQALRACELPKGWHGMVRIHADNLVNKGVWRSYTLDRSTYYANLALAQKNQRLAVVMLALTILTKGMNDQQFKTVLTSIMLMGKEVKTSDGD